MKNAEPKSEGIDLWRELGLDKIEKSAHTRSCILCKEIIDQCSTGGDEYQAAAAKCLRKHAKAAKSNPPPDPACSYSGCVLHEDVPQAVALAMVRIAKGPKAERDVRGVRNTTVPLVVKQDDRPDGFDMTKQDAVHRHFKHLAPSAGDLYFRFGQKRTTVHVWISPAYKSRREEITDPATLEDVLETFEKSVPAIREWAKKKYADLKALAETDLEMEPENEDGKLLDPDDDDEEDEEDGEEE